MPVAVVAALASVRVWAYCMTEYYMEGSMGGWGNNMGPALVEQVSKAHMASRQLARKHVRQQLPATSCTGRPSTWSPGSSRPGDEVIDCTLRGNRVRRFKDFDPVVLPRPTVRLS